MSPHMPKWIARLREYALAHYESNGWSYVVEAFSDADMAEDLKDCSTWSEAFATMKDICGGLHDRDLDNRRVPGIHY